MASHESVLSLQQEHLISRIASPLVFDSIVDFSCFKSFFNLAQSPCAALYVDINLLIIYYQYR